MFVQMSPVRWAHGCGLRSASRAAAQDVLVYAHDVTTPAVVEVPRFIVLPIEFFVGFFSAVREIKVSYDYESVSRV